MTKLNFGEIGFLFIKKLPPVKNTLKKTTFLLGKRGEMQPSLQRSVLYLLDFRIIVKIKRHLIKAF
jgi:hypothetical protein